jgi:hypothetical protein
MKAKNSGYVCVYAILVFLLFTVSAIAAVTGPILQWTRNFGGSLNDNGNAVATTSDGGYVIAGSTYSFGAGRQDIFLVKTDKDGIQQWQRTFGGTSIDYGSSIVETADKGFAIVGYTSSFGAGAFDVFLIKTDSQGNLQWQKTFGGAQNDYGYAVIEASDNGYVVAGTTFSIGAGAADMYLLRTDSMGNQQWEKTFGGADKDYCYSVAKTDDGGYLLAGSTNSKGNGNPFLSDVYMVRTDGSGIVFWEKTFGGAWDDNAQIVRRTSDGGFIIAGTTTSKGAGIEDAYLIKIDSLGNSLWEKTFGGAGRDTCYSVCQSFDGGYVVSGGTYSTTVGSQDIFVVKTDRLGNKEWEKAFGGAGHDCGYSVLQSRDLGYIIAGKFDTLPSSMYVAKTKALDMDADGMPDEWEKTYALNLSSPSDAALDLDNDNLTNLQEFLAGTMPNKYDTDGDGMSDGRELAYGLNPTDPYSVVKILSVEQVIANPLWSKITYPVAPSRTYKIYWSNQMTPQALWNEVNGTALADITTSSGISSWTDKGTDPDMGGQAPGIAGRRYYKVAVQ